jgi:hypothetical protein
LLNSKHNRRKLFSLQILIQWLKPTMELYRAGQQLGGAIGGALGGEDPQLKLISQRQQILGMIDPTNPDSFAQGIQDGLANWRYPNCFPVA